MANGDIAASVGWSTFASSQSAKQGYDNDNYALDRAAEQYKTLRDTVLPAVNQPVFSVRKADYALTLPNNSWAFVNGNNWGAAVVSDGFTKWENGQLTVAKAGVYRLSMGVQFLNTDRDMIAGAQIVRNTTTANTANTLVKAEQGGRGAAKTELVRLVAGDVLAMLVYASHSAATSTTVDNNPFALSMSVEWVRA